VQQQSLAMFAQIRQASALRNASLREKGGKILRDSFEPMIAAP
jgi:hypothetical protein